MDEAELIRTITKDAGSEIREKRTLIGVGDDCAVIRYNKDSYFLISTDSFVDNIHFNRRWFTPIQIGKKFVEVNLSDIAAMGGIPESILISAIIRKEDEKFLIEIYKGIRRQAKKRNISIIGGNISSGKEFSLTATITGTVKKGRLCMRKGANPGDILCVTGKLGKSAGIELCRKGRKKEAIAFLEPTSRIDEAKKISRYATSMIDISDGLGSEIRHLAKASGVGFFIDLKSIPIHDIAKKTRDPLKRAIEGGDDWELLFTIKEKDIKRIRDFCTPIGKAIKEKRIIPDIRRGWDHLSKNS